MAFISRVVLLASFVSHFSSGAAKLSANTPARIEERELSGVNTLKPIHLRSYESALGNIIRRDEGPDNRRRRMKARSQARLIFASDSVHNEATIADLNVDFGRRRAIILEDMMDMISGTRCSGSEIEVILVASEADHQAVEDWKSSSEELFLIMNDEECTGNDERHIYGIKKIQEISKPEEPFFFTVAFTVEEKEWDEVLSDFTMSVGKASFAEPKHLRSRQTIPEFLDRFDLIPDDRDRVKVIDLPLRVGNESEVTNLYPGLLPDLLAHPGVEVDCIGCLLEGTFEATFNYSIRDNELHDFKTTIRTTGFRTQLKTNVVLDDKADVRGLPEVTLFTTEDIPGSLGALSIPRILRVGPALAFKVGLEASVSGALNFTTSVGATIPPDSVVILDIDTPEDSSSNFTMETEHDYEFNSLGANLNVGVYGETSLTFGISILGGKFLLDAGFHLRTPRLSADLTMGYAKDGYCEQDEEERTTGVTIAPKLDAELVINVEKKLGKIGKAEPIVEKTIWEHEIPLGEICSPATLPKPIADQLQKEAEAKEAAERAAREAEELRKKQEEERREKGVLGKPNDPGDGDKESAASPLSHRLSFSIFIAVFMAGTQAGVLL